MSEANRSNVSVYAVDTRGLSGTERHPGLGGGAARGRHDLDEPADEGRGRGDDARRDADHGHRREQPAPQRAADALRPRRGHGRLPRRERERLRQGRRPPGRRHPRLLRDPVLPGRGRLRRRLPADQAVKVTRKDVVLQSRRGYFALPPSDQIVLPYEMPLFMALSSPTPPHDFAHQAAALHFAPGPEGTETSVVVEVPLAAVEFAVDKKKKTFAQRLTTLAVREGRRGTRRRALQRRVPADRPPRPARGGAAVERRPAAQRPPRPGPVHARDGLAGPGLGKDERRARDVRGAGGGRGPAAQQPLPPAAGGPAARGRPALGRPVPVRGHAPRAAPRRAGEPGRDAEPVVLRAPLPGWTAASRRR